MQNWEEIKSGSINGFKKGEIIKLGKEDEVSHVVGSSKDKKNWKEFWLKYTNLQWPKKCQIYNCGEEPTVGAHVYIKYFTGNRWYYILPTCQSCNMDADTDYGKRSAWCSTKIGAVVAATEAKDCCFDFRQF